MKRLLGAIGALLLGFVAVAFAVTPAQASSIDVGSQENGGTPYCDYYVLCYFYRANQRGAVYNANLSSGSANGITSLSGHYFSSNPLDSSSGTQGSGAVVRNAAHSIEDDSVTNLWDFSYVSPNYVGNDDYVQAYGSYGNLYYTLNNEASVFAI